MTNLLAVICGYLIGSISFAVVSSWLFGLPDPRSYGSGNPGATNVLRSGKKAAAAATLIGDATKGAVAVLLARAAAPSLGLSQTAVAAVAVAAFLGHLYPAFFGFKGGKGVATAFGLLVVLSGWVALAAGAAFLGVVLVSRYVSFGSVAAALVAAVMAPLVLGASPAAIAVVSMAVLVIFRHRANIRRLIQGKETKLRLGRSRPPPEQARNG